MVDAGISGYQFVTCPADRLICSICDHPSREPYLSGCCGHTFCKSCLEGSTVCPICHHEQFATTPYKEAEQEIRNLILFCPNKGKGCEWQGKVDDIANHIGNSDDCQFEEVMCSNDCGRCLQRQYLNGHVENECVRRKVDCEYCHLTGEYQFIKSEHERYCPKFLIICPKKQKIASTLKPITTPAINEELFSLSFEGKPYSLLVIPQSSSQLVLSAAQKLEQNLQIDIFGEKLSNLIVLIHLLSCTVHGNTQLVINVRRILRGVVFLCDDTVHTLNEYRRACQETLENIHSAYAFLSEGIEEVSLMIFKTLKDMVDRLKQIIKSQIENFHSGQAENKRFLDNYLITLVKELDRKFVLSQQTYEVAIKENEQNLVSAMEHNKQESLNRQKDNKQWYENKLAEINKKYRESIQENEILFAQKCKSIERAYTDAEKQSTESYKEALQRSAEWLSLTLDQTQSVYEVQLSKNDTECMQRLNESETNFTNTFNSIDNNPLLTIPEEITENDIETMLSSIEQQYREQLQQNEMHYNMRKSDIENEFHRRKRNSKFQDILQSQREDEQSSKEKLISVQIPEQEGFWSSVNPFGRDQRNKEYKAKVDAAQNERNSIADTYQTRENSSESAYQLSMMEYERQKSTKLSQLSDERQTWDSHAKAKRDNAEAKLYSSKKGRDVEITSIKSKRHVAIVQLKTKQEELCSSLQKVKSDNDIVASQTKSQKEIQANKEHLKQDSEALLVKNKAINKADKKRREDIRNAEKEKNNANEMAVHEKDSALGEVSKRFKTENEKAERKKIEADSFAKNIKQDADKHALDGKLKEIEHVTILKLEELKEKYQKQKDNIITKAELLNRIEDFIALLEKEKVEIEQTTSSNFDLQKEKQDKLLVDEEKQVTEIEKLKRKKECYERKMIETASRMQKAVKQKDIETTVKPCVVAALRAIEDTMYEAENFWREMSAVCSYVSDENLMAQIEHLVSSDEATRQKIWTSQKFKSNVLQFYLNCTALQQICKKVYVSVICAREDAHNYMCLYPGKIEARDLELVEKYMNEHLTHSLVSRCESRTNSVKTGNDIDTNSTIYNSTKSNDDSNGIQEKQAQATISARSFTHKAKKDATKVPDSNDSRNSNDDDTDTDDDKE